MGRQLTLDEVIKDCEDCENNKITQEIYDFKTENSNKEE